MIPADMLDSMFQTSAQGIFKAFSNNSIFIAFVIEAYGAGNLPVNRPDIASAIGKACKNGD